jgi:hypothetical protein
LFGPGIFVILRKTLPVPKRSMLVARFRFACLTLAVCLAATPAAAQLIPGWDTKQFTFERIDAERIRLMREVEVNGVGPNQGQQIFAENIVSTRAASPLACSPRPDGTSFPAPPRSISATTPFFATPSFV